jgi:hypothetical protein
MRSPTRSIRRPRPLTAASLLLSPILVFTLGRSALAEVEAEPELGPCPDHATEEVESIQAPTIEDASGAELAKLELAREAIEASRAAGTLFAARPLPDAAPAPPVDFAAQKLQRLEAARAAEILPSELTGFGIETPPNQEVGEPGLSDAEKAKREAFEGADLPGGHSHE